MLNSETPNAIGSNERHNPDKIIKHKTGLPNLAKELGNVSKLARSCTARQAMPASPIGACRGTLSTATSERIAPLDRAMQANAVEDGGVEALFERTRRKPNLANCYPTTHL